MLKYFFGGKTIMGQIKKIFMFVTLQFTIFSIFSFAKVKSKDQYEFNNEPSTKVLVHKILKYVGIGGVSISGIWFLDVLPKASASDIKSHPFELLVIPGGVGLTSAGCILLSHFLDSHEKNSSEKEKGKEVIASYYKSIN